MIIEKYFGIDRETVQQMIEATKTMTNEKSGDNGFQNTKVFLFDEYAVLKMQNMNFRNVTTPDTDLICRFSNQITPFLELFYDQALTILFFVV